MARTVRVEIDSAQPIGGWIDERGRERSRFDGWLQLISSLERAAAQLEPRHMPPGEPPPGTARGL